MNQQALPVKMVERMRLTFVYDSYTSRPGTAVDRGFSCLVETGGSAVLLDAGASARVMRYNRDRLGIDPRKIEAVVISHPHADHTGGLDAVLEANPDVDCYLTPSFAMGVAAARVRRVCGPVQIAPGVISTGELDGIEQSLVLNTRQGMLVLTGCSHPGVARTMRAAAEHGHIWGIAGGLHGFRDLELLDSLSLVCACHCTVYREEMRLRFGSRFLAGGVGEVVELP